MSGGVGRATPEALQRWDAMWRRIDDLVAGGMAKGEAYEYAWAERDRKACREHLEALLDDIRKNGT